jgi:hypothetical protein
MNLDLDLDLDIRNYELRDILNLFKMPSVFNELNMREAKLMVMRTHPDKSGLDKEYFLFFSKAYKILHEVYQVRAGLSRQKDAKYDDVKEDIDARRNANSDKLKRMNADEFNRWFNQTFEQNRLHDEEQDSGYGDWLKSNDADDADNEDNEDNEYNDLGEGSTWAQRMEQLERRKTKLREQALVVRSEVQTFTFDSFGAGSGYGLARECPEEHSSNSFGSGSSLAYEDLKKAHTETVIPVTHEDYEAVRKYKNINELQMSRDVDRRTFNYSETATIMNRSQQLQTEDDMRRAFKLAQQDEVVRDLNQKWAAQFNAIQGAMLGT